MVRARVISARMVELQRAERIGFHTSSIGEEGAIVGAALAAADGDWLFPGRREWYVALARGLPLPAYVHHAFGSAADPAGGHAAPDHAPARKYGVVPPSGVASAHVPQAVGAAWAAKIARAEADADQRTAALCFFGDEVCESGDFHNAMNFSGVFKAPVVFVCRAHADHAPERRRVADRAVAYGVARARVDGGDALAVLAIVRQALHRAREGKGATLLEVATEALPLAGTSPRSIVDLGPADPLTRLRARLDAPDDEALVEETNAELDAAIAAAEAAGPPPRETIFDHVYAAMPRHLAAQRESLKGKRNGDGRG
jgi:TPP-dependent pyruvate/acetoin dehydrogenase alpha subunit